MKKIVHTRIVLLFILCGLYACQKEQEPQPTTSSPISLSIESELEEEDVVPNELRALTFKGGANKHGHIHPSVALKVEAGIISSTLLFYNTATQARFKQENVTWSYDTDKKKLVLKQLKLTNAPANFAQQSPSSWQILCLIGGTLSGDNLNFNSQGASRISTTEDAQAEGIYMSTKWLPLKYDAQKDHLSLSETIHIKNQCMMLLVRLGSNKLGHTAKLQGFRISSDNLSFSGSMNLANFTSASLPSLQGRSNDNARLLQIVGGAEPVAPNSPSAHYVVAVAPLTPQSQTANLMASAFVGESWAKSVELHNQQFRDKAIKPNGYIGINNLKSEPKELEHPIEGLLAWENESNNILTSGNGSSHGAHTTVGYVTNEDGTYRNYNGATKYQLSVLVPGLKSYYGGFFDPSIAFSILDFRQGCYHDTRISTKKDLAGSATGKEEKEELYVFGLPNDQFRSFHAQYKHGGGHKHNVSHSKPANVYYGIRFQDGEGNKYLSAYRYFRNGNNLEVRVRMLGPSRASTTLNQVANEAFWNKPLEWNQREWKRTIGKGGYWSTTKTTRGGAEVHHAMKIFADKSIDRLVAQPDGAYVTTTYVDGRERFLEGNKPANNQFNYLLYTTDKQARPKP